MADSKIKRPRRGILEAMRNFIRPFGSLYAYKRHDLPTWARDSSLGIITDGTRSGYGHNNNGFPDYIIDLISASPVGTRLVSRVASFTSGTGLTVSDEESDEDGAIVINEEGETLESLHYKLATDVAYFARSAARIVYDSGGQIAEIYHVPAERVRYVWPEDDEDAPRFVAVSALWNSPDNVKRSLRHYPIYRTGATPESIRDDIELLSSRYGEEYRGHVDFRNMTSPKNRLYGRPDFYSAASYLEVDGKIGLFHERNVDNNFYLGGILDVVGDADEKILVRIEGDREIYKSRYELLEEMLSDQASGADNAGSIMLYFRNNSEAPPLNYIPIQPNSNAESFSKTGEIALQWISIAGGIPKILLGVPTEGKLGDTQEIRNAISFSNDTTSDLRQHLEAQYLDWGYSGVSIRPISESELPSDIYDSLPEAIKLEFARVQYPSLGQIIEDYREGQLPTGPETGPDLNTDSDGD